MVHMVQGEERPLVWGDPCHVVCGGVCLYAVISGGSRWAMRRCGDACACALRLQAVREVLSNRCTAAAMELHWHERFMYPSVPTAVSAVSAVL